MQQTITDKVYSYSFFALAGAFVLMLLSFSLFSPINNSVGINISSEISVRERQTNSDFAFLFMEDTDEDDLCKEIWGNLNEENRFVIFCLSDYSFPISETVMTNVINNYFHNDLSPPLFLKG